MITQLVNEFPDRVFLLSPVKNEFEKIYLKVREKEKRIYSDEELSLLPFASKNNQNRKEWKLRAQSFNRYNKYLSSFSKNLEILDIGCGNGWFAGKLAIKSSRKFYCIDVNLMELEQAAKVFGSETIHFYYADIFEKIFPDTSFDMITLNSSVQYFGDFNKLILRCLELIKEDGEIHIIDSPFYNDDEIAKAKERTKNYFEELDVPEMIEYYHHHLYSSLRILNYKILYKHEKSIFKLLKGNSPFPWIRIIK